MHIPNRILLVSLIVGFCLFGDSLLYAVLPANVPSFGLKIGLIGIILSANRYVRLFSNSWAAWVYNRIGLKLPLTMAVVGTVISTAIYGISKGLWPLLLARMLWGICFSFLRLGGYLTVLDDSADKNRGLLIGFFNSTWRTGSLLSVVFGSILTDIIGLQTTFLLFAAASAFGLLLIPMLAKVRATSSVSCDNEVVQRLSTPPITMSAETRWVRLFWKFTVSDLPYESHTIRLPLLIVGLAKFANSFAIQGLLVATLGFYLRSQIGDETQLSGITLGVTTVTGILLGCYFFTELMAVVLGHMSDRLGRHFLIYIASPAIVALLLLISFSPIQAISIAALPILFLAGTAVSITLDASVGDLASRQHRAQVLGRYTTWSDLGSASGPLVGFVAVSSVGLAALYSGTAFLLTAILAIYTYVMTYSTNRANDH